MRPHICIVYIGHKSCLIYSVYCPHIQCIVYIVYIVSSMRPHIGNNPQATVQEAADTAVAGQVKADKVLEMCQHMAKALSK